jgi:hypothetical protein
MTPDGRCTARAGHCHHLTYVRLFHERLEDLQALCETHHRALHVWEKNPRCRHCRHRRVFGDMEEVLGFVEANEDLNWDELYDELPTACARCVDARYRLELLRHDGGAGHPNGHHHQDPDTRTNMATKPALAGPRLVDEDLDGLEDQPEAPAKAKAKARARPVIIWTPWPDMEEMMAEKHARWEYRKNVPLNAIDVALSRVNSTRLAERIDQSSIDTLVSRAYRLGHLILPAPLAWWSRLGGLGELLDGNHRDEVARVLGHTHADMYVLVDAGPATVNAVRRSANLLVGKGATADEKLQNAAHYYWENKPTKCSVRMAAGEFGVHPATLADYVRSEEVKRKLSADGDMYVPGADRYNAAVRNQLGKIKNERAFRVAATRLLDVPKFTARHAEQLCQVYRAAPRSDEAQAAAIDAEIERLIAERADEASAKTGPGSLQIRLNRLLTHADKALKVLIPPGVHPKDAITDPKYRATIAALSASVGGRLSSLAEGLA